MSVLEELGKALGGIIVGAIQAGRTRDEALDEAAAKLRRGDVVSDEMWEQLDLYIRDTERFEKEGA